MLLSKTLLDSDNEGKSAKEEIQKEFDKAWKDLSDALKKANKLSQRYSSIRRADQTMSLTRLHNQLDANIELCERDKAEIEFSNRFKKTLAGTDLSLGKAQDIQSKSAGHLEDLLTIFKNARANCPKIEDD